MRNGTYLHTLFCNVAYLLKQDLSKYKVHEVEAEQFAELLEFLKALIADVESLSATNQVSSDNLTPAYAIPVIFEAFELNKENLRPITKKNPVDRKKLFRVVYELLERYFKTKKLDKDIRIALGLFFEALADQYEEPHPFETVETLKFGELEYAE